MKKILYIVAAVVVVVVSLALINNNKSKGGAATIVIGAPLSLTGTAATDGLNIQRGIELAKGDLLKRGVTLKVLYQDDETNPQKTISAINSIMSSDKDVQALIGPTWSFLLDAAGPVINNYKVVSYSPANTSEFINTKSPYIFFGAIKNEKKVAPTTEWLKSMNAKRVAIIVDKSNWGESNLKPFVEAVQQAGAEVVLTDRIPFGADRDTLPTVLAKVKTLKADSILWTGYEDGATILIKKIQELNLNVSLLAASTIPESLVKNKVVFIKPDDKMYYLKTKVSDAFSEEFFKKYAEYPGNYADSAYDAVMIISEAVKNKKADQSVAEYLKNNIDYKGFQTEYSFDSNGDISGGEWVVDRL